MSIRDELLALQQADPERMLHVEVAETWARANPESDTHGALEWDDRKAGQQFRYVQLRQLVRIHVVNETREPQFVNLSIDRVQGGGYRSIDDVMPSVSYREIMLRDALAELERLQKKYARLTELAKIWSEMEAARQAEAIRAAAEAQRAPRRRRAA